MENKCKLCGSLNLEFKDNYSLFNPETDEDELVSGLSCLDCECFHNINNNWFQYEVQEQDITRKCFK